MIGQQRRSTSFLQLRADPPIALGELEETASLDSLSALSPLWNCLQPQCPPSSFSPLSLPILSRSCLFPEPPLTPLANNTLGTPPSWWAPPRPLPLENQDFPRLIRVPHLCMCRDSAITLIVAGFCQDFLSAGLPSDYILFPDYPARRSSPGSLSHDPFSSKEGNTRNPFQSPRHHFLSFLSSCRVNPVASDPVPRPTRDDDGLRTPRATWP